MLIVTFTQWEDRQTVRIHRTVGRGQEGKKKIPWEWEMELLKVPDEIVTPF
jgi:hypothetical protein